MLIYASYPSACRQCELLLDVIPPIDIARMKMG